MLRDNKSAPAWEITRPRVGEIPAEVSWRTSQIPREIQGWLWEGAANRWPGLLSPAGPGGPAWHRELRDGWRNTGCRGVVLKRRLLDSKRDWQAQGEKSDRFQPEGTAQALTHSPLMINIPPLHHHTCQIHQEHHRAEAVLSAEPNALRDSTKLSGCTGNPKTPLSLCNTFPKPFSARAAQFVIKRLELFTSHRHQPPGLLLLLFSPG